MIAKLQEIETEINHNLSQQIGRYNINPSEIPRDLVTQSVKQRAEGLKEDLKKRLEAEYFSEGPLVELIKDESITEIIVNSFDSIHYEKNGKWYTCEDQFFSDRTYTNFLNRLYSEAGIQIHRKQLFNTNKWKNFRLHVSSPLITESTCISLRRHPESSWNFKQLLDLEWCGDFELETILDIIQSKENFLVIGPTGSGKTSVLNACLQEVKNERCVLLEDTSELKTPNDLSIKMLTLESVDESKTKSVDLQDLVKQSLRMRPDRLVMGEIRGAEAKDLLMCLATGHAGSMGSIHASNATESLLRLEMLIQLGAPHWNIESVRKLIMLSLRYLIVVSKDQEGKRRLNSIHKIVSLEKYGLILQKVI
ncbi:MAG: ATPase, T2SS/T4P/T4SS family [Bdellovibrionales bacterium]